MFFTVFLLSTFTLTITTTVLFVEAAHIRKLQQSCVVYASHKEVCPPINLNSEGKFRLVSSPKIPVSLSCLLILETQDGWRSAKTREADGTLPFPRTSEFIELENASNSAKEGLCQLSRFSVLDVPSTEGLWDPSLKQFGLRWKWIRWVLLGMGVGIIPTICGNYARKRRRERREAAIVQEEQDQLSCFGDGDEDDSSKNGGSGSQHIQSFISTPLESRSKERTLKD